MTNKLKNSKILNISKKIKSINYLGGCCINCGEKDIFKLTFHHRDPNDKEFTYCDYKYYRWSILVKELDKCDLMCNNCHRELHYNISELKYGDSRRKDKEIYLEYGGSKCIKCGYDKCPASLTFHHRDPNDKKFNIGNLNTGINSIEELSTLIKEELDKCDVLCSNCHTVEHSDVDFFEKFKDEIYKKVDSYKELNPKVDRDKIWELYESGYKLKEISEILKCGKSTISEAVTEIKSSKGIIDDTKRVFYKNTDDELIEAVNTSYNTSQVCKKLGISTSNYRNIRKRMDKLGLSFKEKTPSTKVIKKTNKCIDCESLIQNRSKRCKKCDRFKTRKVGRPPYEQLLKELENGTYRSVAKKYGVSANAVIYWVKQYQKEST